MLTSAATALIQDHTICTELFWGDLVRVNVWVAAMCGTVLRVNDKQNSGSDKQ